MITDAERERIREHARRIAADLPDLTPDQADRVRDTLARRPRTAPNRNARRREVA